jgi:hypothetical protein
MKKIQEDGAVGGAPANAAGGGAIASIGVSAPGKPANWSEPGLTPKQMKKHKKNASGILRRPPPNLMHEETKEVKTGTFAGNQTFIVPSNVFHKAKHEKRKGKHWKTYIGEDEHGQAIREYDRKSKGKKPIILQDESTGAMCYAKYGKERNLQEAPLISDIKRKERFSADTGQKFHPSEKTQKIGSVGSDHNIYHTPDEWSDTGHSLYHVVHRDSGKVTTTIYGKRNPKSKSFAIDTIDSTGKGPKAHKVYRKILQSGHSTSLVGSSHSEGGQKIWQKLSSEKGVSVHGWHRGKAVNIDPKDPEETHVPSSEAEKGYLRRKVDPVGRATYKMKLVASLHKRKTV